MTLVLVEGPSDAVAVETLARLRGTDLAAAGVRIESMGGITNLGRRIVPDVRRTDTPYEGAERLGLSGEPLLLLYDAGEAAYVHRTLERTGAAVSLHVCDADLEDELIRALGVPAVLEVVDRAGDRDHWQSLLLQPFHRDRPVATVLRRFLGTTRGRKIRYAGLLVAAAVELDCVPPPLAALLSDATGS